MKHSFFRSLIELPNIATMLNLLSGVASVVLVINKYYTIAVLMLIAAVVLDGIDGKLASLLDQSSDFGRELDSLADIVSFGVAPAVLGYSLAQGIFPALAAGFFVLCSALRLARYNVMKSGRHFCGMPTTMNGILLPAIYFAGLPFDYYAYFFIISGVLMISPVKFRRIL